MAKWGGVLPAIKTSRLWAEVGRANRCCAFSGRERGIIGRKGRVKTIPRNHSPCKKKRPWKKGGLREGGIVIKDIKVDLNSGIRVRMKGMKRSQKKNGKGN